MSLQIRWMIRRDLEDVLAIEQQCFPVPWTEEDFLTCLRQRNCIGMVAERDELILGYMLYELLKCELHLLNFAVAPEFQRSGVGAAMIDKLQHKLHVDRRRMVSLEINEQNLPGQLFFQRQGFRCVKVLRDYYIEEYGGGDAYQFRYELPQAVNQWETVPSEPFEWEVVG